MTRIFLFVLGAAVAMGCAASVDVARNSGASQHAPDGSTTAHGGSSPGAQDGSSPSAPDGSISAHDGSTAIVDNWVPITKPLVDGMFCEPVLPTTPSGTCPVMPRGGGPLCSPPRDPLGPCGSRGLCSYGTLPGMPEQTCSREVCTDERGNCPPQETVCKPVQSCTSAADCHGNEPGHECSACPLAPDGTQTISCWRWNCAEGKCVLGSPCDEPIGLKCPGGHGCPSYYFAAFDKTCASDSDCTVFDHFESCCSTRAIGVSLRDKVRVDGIEAACDALLDPFARICGCQPMHPAEDGSYPQSGQEIVGACVAGSCQAVVRGRIECGAITCAEGESCCGGADARGYCISFCATSCPAPYWVHDPAVISPNPMPAHAMHAEMIGPRGRRGDGFSRY